MILDLHIHSKYSFDSLSEPGNIIKAAIKKGLNGVAITDHDTIQGGIEAQKINQDPNFLVIVGAEVNTDIGDIIGLFLHDEIQSRNSIEVVDEIHRQGGIAILPHPYKGHILKEEIIKKIDVIEGFNSRTSEENNKKAERLAKQYNKAIVVGSDAHFYSEIGLCKVIINSTDAKNAILNGKVELITNMTPMYMECFSQIIKSIKLKRFRTIPTLFIFIFLNILRRLGINIRNMLKVVSFAGFATLWFCN